MSKAEERAFKEYPVVMTTLIPADDEHPLIEQDCNKYIREAYIKGYSQAEKDMELTWRDIDEIEKIANVLEIEWLNSTPWDGIREWYFYQEVLKRFKARKNNEDNQSTSS